MSRFSGFIRTEVLTAARVTGDVYRDAASYAMLTFG